jgi:hypothetical protein
MAATLCAGTAAARLPGSSPAPAAPRAVSATRIAAGGIAGCGWTADDSTGRLLDVLPGTVAALGDEAYMTGSDEDFRSCYGPAWGRQLARTRPVDASQSSTRRRAR